MTDTPHLGLPLLAAAQAQKHVTHNEALLAIDALLHCAVLDRDLAAPPGSPASGARYIVAAGATGTWSGRAGQLAVWQDGLWTFLPPKPGHLFYVRDEACFCVFTGSAWQALTEGLPDIQNLALFGLGTEADAANPFSGRLNAALWTARETADGGTGDLRCTFNKEGAANVLSLLFQSAYSGRLEIGLIGSNDPAIKVSPDGTAWHTALAIDGASGKVGFPSGTDDVLPASDNTRTSGSSARRWSTVYAASGVVTTSDATEKTDLRAFSDAELDAWDEVESRLFRFRSAVDQKGDRARSHAGYLAQDVAEAFRRHGLDPAGSALWCADPAPDGRERYGLRYDQCAVIESACQRRRIARLETRLATLERNQASLSTP